MRREVCEKGRVIGVGCEQSVLDFLAATQSTAMGDRLVRMGYASLTHPTKRRAIALHHTDLLSAVCVHGRCWAAIACFKEFMSRMRSQKSTGELVGFAVGNVPYKIGDRYETKVSQQKQSEHSRQ